MKSFIELAAKRHSCRAYEATKVESDKLNTILEAGRIAPSAVNYQPWRFIVFQTEEALEKIHNCYHRDWFNSSPCVVLVCTDHNKSWKRKEDGKDHADIDAAIAIDHMTLAATSVGLATCWVCNFDVQKTINLFNIPANLEPVALLPVGYAVNEPDVNRHNNKRKSLEEIVEFR